MEINDETRGRRNERYMQRREKRAAGIPIRGFCGLSFDGRKSLLKRDTREGKGETNDLISDKHS
jgi:hypothetical protein